MVGQSGTARKRRRHTPVGRDRLSGEERGRAALQVTAELGNSRDAYRFNAQRRRRNTGNGEGRRGWHEEHARNNRHQQTRTIRTNRYCGADDRLRGGAQNRLPEMGGHGALMLPIAAAASGQGRFGTEIEKWDEKRQEKERKEHSTNYPQTQAVGTPGTTTTNGKTRHKTWNYTTTSKCGGIQCRRVTGKESPSQQQPDPECAQVSPWGKCGATKHCSRLDLLVAPSSQLCDLCHRSPTACR